MRKTLALAAAAVMILAMCACSGESETKKGYDYSQCTNLGDRIYQCDVQMSDTRRVTCLLFRPGGGGGIDCDWTHVDGADNL